jgi:hypothetical protein
LQGEIKLASQVGVGSTFTVTLPLEGEVPDADCKQYSTGFLFQQPLPPPCKQSIGLTQLLEVLVMSAFAAHPTDSRDSCLPPRQQPAFRRLITFAFASLGFTPWRPAGENSFPELPICLRQESNLYFEVCLSVRCGQVGY